MLGILRYKNQTFFIAKTTARDNHTVFVCYNYIAGINYKFHEFTMTQENKKTLKKYIEVNYYFILLESEHYKTKILNKNLFKIL